MNTNLSARAIAFYLPQFHPIPENDLWWGKGFTEWTNTAKAKPMFPGHYQPRVPADLGFYDLRVPETRDAQAEMARAHGIEGFCYWHYWFAGRRLLERPFNEVLQSGKPDFPFALGWANHSWTGIWYGAPGRVLVEQTYPGLEDHAAHFRFLLQAFSDPRYITVEGKPLFVLFRPKELPDSKRVTDFWRDLAIKAGLKGLHLVGISDDLDSWNPLEHGFDAVTIARLGHIFRMRSVSPVTRVRRKLSGWPVIGQHVSGFRNRPTHVYPYAKASPHFVVQQQLPFEYYPCVIPNWDNTARSGTRGSVLTGSTPEEFGRQMHAAVQRVKALPPEHRLIFVKSWNEWAEGNYLEPDLKFGDAYLRVVRDELAGGGD
jgi:lipopolysaccharide biosynthesis protein